MGKPYFFLLLLLIACGPASAQIANGGTSENSGRVFWLTWDNSVEKKLTSNSSVGTWSGALEEATYTWYFTPDVRIKATITNLEEYRNRWFYGPGWWGIESRIEAYTPGTWKGDGLGEMYAGPGGIKYHDDGAATSVLGVEKSGLATQDGKTVRFDISLELEFKVKEDWSSVPYPGMVIADAEELNGDGEYISALTNNTSTAWQLIDKRTANKPEDYRLTFNDSGTQFRIQAYNKNIGNQAVLFARGATGLNNVEMKGGGKTALALGFVLPFDVSETEGYCEARHYIDDFEEVETNFDRNTNLDQIEETPLNPVPTLYIGSSANPLDNGSLDEQELEINFTQNQIEIRVPVTNEKAGDATLYWWVDFNDDGIFAENEVKSFPDVAPGFSSEEVTLVFTEDDFPGEYIGRNLKVGPLHSRLRITTTNLEDVEGTTQDERSCALAEDGEVEDYIFTVKGINISGTVLIDPDGFTNNGISGIGSGSLLSGETTHQLYAYLTKKDDGQTVVGKATIGTDGSYAITNMNHGSYTLSISFKDVEVGEGTLVSLGPHLPPTWFPVGESFGVDNAYEAETTFDTELDAQVAIETPEAGMDISGVDFGVDQPPFLEDNMESIAAYEFIEVLVLENDTDPQGKDTMVPSSLKLVDAAGNLVEGIQLVTAEGTFRITVSHGISFKPFNSFHGKTTSISYVLEDKAGLLSDPAVLTFEVGRPRMIISNPMLPHRAKLAE